MAYASHANKCLRLHVFSDFFRNHYHIPANLLKPLTYYTPKPFSWITSSIGENCMKIRSVVFQLIVFRQTDIAGTLFYSISRHYINKWAMLLEINVCITYVDINNVFKGLLELTLFSCSSSKKYSTKYLRLD